MSLFFPNSPYSYPLLSANESIFYMFVFSGHISIIYYYGVWDLLTSMLLWGKYRHLWVPLCYTWNNTIHIVWNKCTTFWLQLYSIYLHYFLKSLRLWMNLIYLRILALARDLYKERNYCITYYLFLSLFEKI